MNDKVAIITPSFNRGYIIRETAESVFAQSHENWEWIIVDDGTIVALHASLNDPKAAAPYPSH